MRGKPGNKLLQYRSWGWRWSGQYGKTRVSLKINKKADEGEKNTNQEIRSMVIESLNHLKITEDVSNGLNEFIFAMLTL